MAKLSDEEINKRKAQARQRVKGWLHPEIETEQRPQLPRLPKVMEFLRRPRVNLPQSSEIPGQAPAKKRQYPFVGMP